MYAIGDVRRRSVSNQEFTVLAPTPFSLIAMALLVLSGAPVFAVDGQPITPSSVMTIPSVSLSKYEQRALSGNGSAAYRLYLHFDAARMPHQAAYWAQIAAENNDRDGQYALAALLFEGGTSKGCRRARYWIDRAAANKAGFPDSSSATPSGIPALIARFTRKCGVVEVDVGPAP